MNIIASPAFKNKNPYNKRLYGYMIDNGHKVIEFKKFSSLAEKEIDIFHCHWPEAVMDGRDHFFFNVIRVILFYSDLLTFKLRGTKIIWTAHNLKSHEFDSYNTVNQKLETWLWNKFINRLVDGIIVLNKDTEAFLREKYRIGKKILFEHIPHPNYRGLYKKLAQDTARSKWNLDQDHFVFGFFGIIRGYKNVVELAKTFSEISDDTIELLIAGHPENPQIKKELESLATNNSHIHLHLKRMNDDELSEFFSAVDLMVLPFKKINNSGSAILSVSMDKPILVPQLGVFEELKKVAGFEWVQYFDTFNKEALLEAKSSVEKMQKSASTTNGIDQWDNDKLSRRTIDFLEKVLAND